MALAVAIPVHNHMGFDVVITDYLHGAPNKAARAVNWGIGVATMAGLAYFNVNDVGICEGLRTLWAM